MLFCAISVCAKAQEADSLQAKTNISIEELATKLDKLQHDYDYLQCENDLTKEVMSLTTFSNRVSISAQSLLIKCYHGQFSQDQYNSQKELYYALNDTFNAHKSKIESLKEFVSLKINSRNFSEFELNLLNSAYNATDTSIAEVECALRYFKLIIDIYKDLE